MILKLLLLIFSFSIVFSNVVMNSDKIYIELDSSNYIYILKSDTNSTQFIRQVNRMYNYFGPNFHDSILKNNATKFAYLNIDNDCEDYQVKYPFTFNRNYAIKNNFIQAKIYICYDAHYNHSNTIDSEKIYNAKIYYEDIISQKNDTCNINLELNNFYDSIFKIRIIGVHENKIYLVINDDGIFEFQNGILKYTDSYNNYFSKLELKNNRKWVYLLNNQYKIKITNDSNDITKVEVLRIGSNLVDNINISEKISNILKIKNLNLIIEHSSLYDSILAVQFIDVNKQNNIEHYFPSYLLILNCKSQESRILDLNQVIKEDNTKTDKWSFYNSINDIEYTYYFQNYLMFEMNLKDNYARSYLILYDIKLNKFINVKYINKYPIYVH